MNTGKFSFILVFLFATIFFFLGQNLNSEQLQPLYDFTNVDYQENKNITNIEISDNNINVKMNLKNL